MELSRYNIKNKKISGKIIFALICDLHGCRVDEAIELLHTLKPDYILASGDIFERLDGSCDDINEVGFELLGEAVKIAPTFYAFGNHEIGGTRSWMPFVNKNKAPVECSRQNRSRIENIGVHILDDTYEIFDGFAFGGLSSGILNCGKKPNLDWLDDFCKEPMPKILLCHHPEYYKKYLRCRNIDLIVSGHAHGGQWRFFGRGVFAPGQGIFPKYTSGVYENRLVVSRGMKDIELVPRIFNKTEIVAITIN